MAKERDSLSHNGSRTELTPLAIKYLFNKYIKDARTHHPRLIPDTISSHSFRYSKAMHLLQSGHKLEYTCDFMAH